MSYKYFEIILQNEREKEKMHKPLNWSCVVEMNEKLNEKIYQTFVRHMILYETKY